MNITLTADQEAAKTAILDFIFNPAEKCFLLSGYAGTGKTTLINHVEEAYSQQCKLREIVQPNFQAMDWEYSATTHKAAEALAHATQKETRTIHAVLNLKLGSDFEKGTQFLYKSKREPDPENKIIVIDECSYVDERLLHLITQHSSSCKIIFMGDVAQLTPVKSTTIPVFTQKYPTAHLSKVMRQGSGNPIIEICAGLRATILDNASMPKITLCSEIIHLDTAAFEQALVDEFTRSDWSATQSKILAWTNKEVQRYNRGLFKAVHNRSKFEKGDYVTNNHYVQGIKTDAEFCIHECVPHVDLDIEGFRVTTPDLKGIFVPANIADYDKTKNRMVKEGNTVAVQHIMETWGDLRPSYACTINKSQGSTYDKVFIDLRDLRKCRDMNQLVRLLYVAMSRARNQVIFTGDL